MAPVVGGGASDTTRTLSAHAGMSFGLETFPRDMPGSPAAPLTATWSGRATGHAQDADGRWVLEGDAVLEARLEGPSGAVTGGEIRNMRIAPFDPRSLQVDTSRAARGTRSSCWRLRWRETAIGAGFPSGARLKPAPGSPRPRAGTRARSTVRKRRKPPASGGSSKPIPTHPWERWS